MLIIIIFLSPFLRNCFLCWDHWNSDVMPTLDAGLLCSSRAGSDLGSESGLVFRSYISDTHLVRVISQFRTYERDIIPSRISPSSSQGGFDPPRYKWPAFNWIWSGRSTSKPPRLNHRHAYFYIFFVTQNMAVTPPSHAPHSPPKSNIHELLQMGLAFHS